MAVTYRTIQTSTTSTVSKPASLANGDLMLAFVPSTLSVSTPSGWTLITSKSNGSAGTPDRMTSYYRHVTTASSESASWTFTNGLAVILLVFYGHVTSSPIDYSFSYGMISTDTQLNFTTGFNVAFDGSFAVIGACTDGTPDTTVPSGWTFHGTFDGTTNIARKAVNAGSLGTLTWDIGTGIQTGTLVVIKPLINVSTAVPTATSTSTMPNPGIKGNVAAPALSGSSAALSPVISAQVITLSSLMSASSQAYDPSISVGTTVLAQPPTATASSNALEPSVFSSISTAAQTSTASAAIAPPQFVGGAAVAPNASTATGSLPIPSTTTGALQLATLLNATSAMLAPSVSGGALVVAGTQNVSCLFASPTAIAGALVSHATATASAGSLVPDLLQYIPVSIASANAQAGTPTALGGALLSSAAMSASMQFATPKTLLTISSPIMVSTASAFGATALGGAILAPLHGTASISAVAPKAGVDKRSGSWRNRHASVSIRTNNGTQTLNNQPSATYYRRGITSSQSQRIPVAASISENKITGNLERREE